MRKAFTQAVGYEGKAFGKRHWLAGDMKLPYCLFSALARSEDGAELREIARSGDPAPDKIIPFFDLDGGKAKGFEVVKLPSDVLSGLYEANKACQTKTEDDRNEGGEDGERDGGGKDGHEDGTPVFGQDGKLVLPDYQYQNSVDIPFKVSVTGIAGDGKPSDTTHVDLPIRSVDDFESDNVSLLTSAAKGTILHRIMRFIDLEGLRTGKITFEDETDSLIKGGYLNICSDDNAREVAGEFKNGILAFCNNLRCEDIIKSFADGTARSEKPIVFGVYTEGNKGDTALGLPRPSLSYLERSDSPSKILLTLRAVMASE